MGLNPEKVLRLLNAINLANDSYDGCINYRAYYELKDYATDALAFEIANKRGGSKEVTRRRTALAYLKREKRGLYKSPYWCGNSWIKDGYQFFTNNVSAYRFAEGHYIDGLPQISPEEYQVPNISVFFNMAAGTTCEATIGQKDLELAIAKWKAEGKPGAVLYYPVGIADYDAEMLLDTLKILGVEEAIIRQREPNDAAYIVLDGREAAFMPIGQKTE
jgi:hypothetical protein